MAKKVVHECDKCEKQLVSKEMPANWVEAMVTFSSNSSNSVIFIWCDSCYKTIREKYPQAIQLPQGVR